MGCMIAELLVWGLKYNVHGHIVLKLLNHEWTDFFCQWGSTTSSKHNNDISLYKGVVMNLFVSSFLFTHPRDTEHLFLLALFQSSPTPRVNVMLNVHPLKANFVYLLFRAGQWVSVGAFVAESSCLLRLELQSMKAVRVNQNNKVAGCKTQTVSWNMLKKKGRVRW